MIQEFYVQVQKLKSWLKSHSNAKIVRGLHLKKIAPEQKKALHDYFIELDIIGIPSQSNMICLDANYFF